MKVMRTDYSRRSSGQSADKNRFPPELARFLKRGGRFAARLQLEDVFGRQSQPARPSDRQSWPGAAGSFPPPPGVSAHRVPARPK